MNAPANLANLPLEFLKWTLAALAGAVLPAAGFCLVLLGTAWTVQPSWVPLTISIVPLAAGLLLPLPAARFEKVYRRAFWAFVLHAALMGAMIEAGWWTFAAGVSPVRGCDADFRAWGHAWRAEAAVEIDDFLGCRAVRAWLSAHRAQRDCGGKRRRKRLRPGGPIASNMRARPMA